MEMEVRGNGGFKEAFVLGWADIGLGFPSGLAGTGAADAK
jgi:hypothetical protein